jgi:anti-sigma regulatory factor (Ser/Thr protein kinase)
MGFAMSLSEACQNIVEHAGRGGWVMVQRYDWSNRRAGRDVVQIAVCDAGQGFRKSLDTSRARANAGERWSDGDALESGVMQGVSRYTDPGRGQGLTGIRGYVFRFDGKLTVRSGTAKIAMLPDWVEDRPRQDGLTPFPGAQLQIMIPKRIKQP